MKMKTVVVRNKWTLVEKTRPWIRYLVMHESEPMLSVEYIGNDDDLGMSKFSEEREVMASKIVEALEPEPSKHVYVLAIHHRFGENVSVHATQESADQGLLAYVKDEWKGEVKGPYPVHKTDTEIVEEYFERVEREYADICEAEVQP